LTETAQAEGEREREAGSLVSREPDEGLHAGLDPRTMGSRRKPKAEAQPSHPGAPQHDEV